MPALQELGTTLDLDAFLISNYSQPSLSITFPSSYDSTISHEDPKIKRESRRENPCLDNAPENKEERDNLDHNP